MSAFAGTTDTATNLAPTFVWVAFWVAVPLATVVLGDFYTALDPWRTIARLAAPRTARSAARRDPRALPGARRALARRRRPRASSAGWSSSGSAATTRARSALVILAYGAIQLAGHGALRHRRVAAQRRPVRGLHARPVARRAGRRRGPPRLAARPAVRPAVARGRRGHRRRHRRPHRHDVVRRPQPRTLWAKIVPSSARGSDLGSARRSPTSSPARSASPSRSRSSPASTGSASAGCAPHEPRRTSARRSARASRTRSCRSRVAYVVAHYFSLLALQGQAIAYLASDPLGDGSNIFGTASARSTTRCSSAGTIWDVQVVALVSGHVGGLVLAHDRALTTYRRPPRRDALAVLDARRDGRLHEPRALAAVGA